MTCLEAVLPNVTQVLYDQIVEHKMCIFDDNYGIILLIFLYKHML